MANPTLKFKTVFVYGGTVQFDVDFPKQYLIVDIVCPDAPVDSELSFNRSNLKPYELCVQKRLAGDYMYSKNDINQIGVRTLFGLYPLFQSIPTAYDDGMLFFIISYLEFNDLDTFRDSKSAKRNGIKFVQLIEPITQIVLAVITLLKKN